MKIHAINFANTCHNILYTFIYVYVKDIEITEYARLIFNSFKDIVYCILPMFRRVLCFQTHHKIARPTEVVQSLVSYVFTLSTQNF